MAAERGVQLEPRPAPSKRPIRVEELASFTREARKVLSVSELSELRHQVAQMRELGSVIKGTGGLRKMRWQIGNGKGKSGGARVLYYYSSDDMPIYLVAFYEKSRKTDLSAAERKAAKKFIQALKSAQSAKRRPKLQLVK